MILFLMIDAGVSLGAQSSDKPLLLRQPTVNASQICFSYAGDLWLVPRGGGEATRLTTGIGTEQTPLFSPDGQTIAFTGEYDGNVDIYTVPAVGGVPKRLTWHPGADRLVGWTPDGRSVLFVSPRNSYSNRFARLFTLPIDGVFPTEAPVPMGYEGAYSPDGAYLAYVPLPRAFNAWKRYRGGMATPIWIAKLADSSVQMLPRVDSNDFNPMWVGDQIYFLSDRSGPISLFSFDRKTEKVKKLIENTGLDIKSASAGPGAIVYEQFGGLYLYDLKSQKSAKVDVRLDADIVTLRPKYEKVGNRLDSASISPSGVRALFEAHGEILTAPAEKGDPRNLTNTPGVAERDPAWSPDGKWIAYFSDESGEYALHLRQQSGLGEVKKIDLGTPPNFFYNPVWSPDSKKIAYTDRRLNIWYVEIEQAKPVKVDTGGRGGVRTPSWSPDSRWLVYEKPLPSWFRAVFIYSLEDGSIHQITDGMSDAGSAIFDKGGKYIYFTGSTDIGPRIFGFDMSSYPLRPTRSVYLVVLKKDAPSPLAPESDEEKIGDDKKDGDKEDKDKKDQPEESDTAKAADQKKEPVDSADGKDKKDEKKEPPKVEIDFDNIGQRILALDVPPRNIVGLAVGKANILFIAEAPYDQPGPDRVAIIHKYDLEKRKLEKVIEGVRTFDVSANGEKMLYRQGENWFIAAAGQPPKPGEGKLKTDDIQVHVDPKAEWEQMYREVWRIERDFFYDPNYHGLDLKATAAKYRPYLDSIVHRAELNYLFQEMLGELSVGHLYVGGGDLPDPKRVPGGLLGADYTIENGRYRFDKVYNGENWNPNLRAPLTQPGVNVTAGEYLLAVNGRELSSADNLYGFFENTAGKQVVLKVGPNPDGSGSREVTVVPVGSEVELRNLDWVEENRRKVDEASGGKLGYVYLPDTAQGGYTAFNRYFFSQTDKQGMVVDERFNSGGQAADWVVDYLTKPLMSYWAVRAGDDFRQPFGTILGPKAMLVNEYSGSGGDLLPYMFRRAKVGPLIGKRTWGGLVGIGGYPQLIDGGSVTAPFFAFYTPEGQWQIENHGVDPDQVVEFDPAAWRHGKDPQLEKAVQYLLDELKRNPVKTPKRPPYPNYHPATAPGPAHD
jgi:tricorn protease